MKQEQIRLLKRIIGIGLMLLLTIFSFEYSVMLVHADGAVSATEVWVEWRYPSNLGMTTTAGTGNSLEDSTWMNVFNVTGTAVDVDYDNLTIYYMQGYIHSDDADDREVRAYGYNWTSNTNAGAQFGESVETWLETPTGVYSWKGGSLTTPIVMNDDRIFFYGLYAIAEGGNYVLAHPSAGGYYVYRNTIGDDPFTESTSGANAYSIIFRVEGDYNTTTTHNQYYGTATDYIARRDINYTFPTGSNNRQIRLVYAKTESVRNITYSNGGLWDSMIPSTDYTDVELNGTHQVVTLDDTDIGNYGGDLRFYTQSDNYVYTIEGAFYENGTNYGAVNITAHTTTNSTLIEVDGETTYGSDDEVLLLVWSLAGGGSRRFYTPYQTETLNVFFPEATFATYSFSMIDYTGKLGEGTSYLEAYRTVNSTEELIERMKIQDVINVVPLTLVEDQTYRLKVLWYDGTVYDWGYFVAGVDPTPTIVLSDLTFSQKAQLTYKYINIEATRPTATHIRVNYDDNAPATYGTNWCNITVAFRNGTYVTGYNSQDETFSWNWYSANNLTDYWVVVEIDHGFFGLLDYSELLDYDRTYNQFPDLGILGTFGGINTANLTCLILVLGVFGGFSRYSASLALILAFSMAGILRLIGANTWDYNVLALGLALSIGFTVYQGRVRP